MGVDNIQKRDPDHLEEPSRHSAEFAGPVKDHRLIGLSGNALSRKSPEPPQQFQSLGRTWQT